jgi:hypothetical protein
MGSLVLGAAMLVCASNVSAGGSVPSISGSYRLQITTFCGLPVEHWPGSVTKKFDGEAQTEIGIFAVQSPGKASFSGSYSNTQVITPNSTGGSAQTGAFGNSSSSAFSNTATSFTFEGQTYQVFYGSVNGSNVSQKFEFMNTSTQGGATAPNCINWGKADRL